MGLVGGVVGVVTSLLDEVITGLAKLGHDHPSGSPPGHASSTNPASPPPTSPPPPSGPARPSTSQPPPPQSPPPPTNPVPNPTDPSSPGQPPTSSPYPPNPTITPDPSNPVGSPEPPTGSTDGAEPGAGDPAQGGHGAGSDGLFVSGDPTTGGGISPTGYGDGIAGATDTRASHYTSSSTWPLINTASPTFSSNGSQSTGKVSGRTRVHLAAGAVAAISITACIVVAVALLCCWRAFLIRRRRARGETQSSWARRPVFSYARRTTVDSTIGFTIPRASSDAESFEYISRPGSSSTGHFPSWNRISAAQQRRPPSDSCESYGTPLPPDRRSLTPLPSPPEMAQKATVSMWTYHPNAPLSPISSQGHQALSVESHITSEWHAMPLHSKISLEAVGVPSSPTRDGAVSPFVTRIVHPDGAQELGEDLDSDERPSSPRMLRFPPRAMTPVTPLYATSFGDPFASPQDGAARV